MLDLARTLAPETVAAQIEVTCQELAFNPSLLDRVLELKAQFANDGNRRRLFAALDDLIPEQLPAWRARLVPFSRGTTRLRRLVLRNWKVFAAAELAFPYHDDDRPVVLIGGKNGYGKTSLLEALRYGLFGLTAATDPFQRDAGGATARHAVYRTFLERALHRPARERGDGQIMVRTEWETPEGPLVVERRWYFDDELRFIPEDETVTLWVGAAMEALSAPADAEPTTFYQQELERRLLPASLAPFVFFDGEQVKRFAEKRVSDQVRLAAEAVMGLSEWRDAANDLKAYARDRAKGQSRADADLATAAGELLALEAEDAEVTDQIAEIDAQRSKPRQARDALLGQLAPLENGTYATLHELLERQQSIGQELARARHEFATAASAAAPLALASSKLLDRLGEALRTELQQDRPWRDLFGDEGARAAFLSALAAETGPEATGLTEAVQRAWERMTEAPIVVGALRHEHLGGARTRVMQALAAGPDLARLTAASQRLGQLEAEAADIAEGLAGHRRRDSEAAEIREKLAALNTSLAQLDGEGAALLRRQDEVRRRLEQLRAQTLASAQSSEGAGDRPQKALHAALAIERIVDAVRPVCFEALGSRITQAYQALAHKGLVTSVRVAPNGDVALLDANNRDLLAFEASAGESQIFAMSLLAAVGDLAPNRLPVVIDTPLGRLDPDHRERILKYFTHRPHQTFLLSQPDEVNGRYLDMIEQQVAARFRLDHASAANGGPGGSVPTPGAYPDLAA